MFIAATCVSSCARAPGPAQASHVASPAGAAPADNYPARGGATGAGWWRGEVFYEVFIRSFADSGSDGIGDLAGLTGKLDHIQGLGAGAIWLMPIHPSPSYHGYDVTDYRAIHPDYGSLADFDELVRQARARGIEVVIDLVLNHSSSHHPYFRTRPDFYLWRDQAPDWKRPWDGAPVWHEQGGRFYYGLFWSGMPDLNLASPAVEAEMLDVMRFWVARGVAGFRVDAARHLIEGPGGEQDRPESNALISRMRAALDEDRADVLFLAEAWTSLEAVASYASAYQLAFGFDVAGAIGTAVRDGQKVELVSALSRAETAYSDRAFEAPFLSNHDMVRVMRTFGGDAAKMRVAAAILYSLPGSPFLYYGEELGMQGGPSKRDEDKRTVMRWNGSSPGFGFTAGTSTWHGEAGELPGVDVESQARDPRSLLSLYRRLGALRGSQPALRDGGAKVLRPAARSRGVFGILRASSDAAVVFVANVAAEPSAGLELPLGGDGRWSRARVLLEEGLPAGTTELAVSQGALVLPELGGRAFAYLTLER